MSGTRIWQIALAATLVVTVVALVFRAPWRDEYWTLYIAGGDTTWAEMLTTRQMNDIHPPLAYFPLHIWDGWFHNDLAARFLNIFYLAGGFALAWFAGRDRPKETAVYLFICATSFWFTFYGVEVRNYALLFGLVVPAVPAARRAFQGDKLNLGWLAVWFFLAMAMSFTHYYGTLLVGGTGLVAGVLLLLRKRFADFLIVGVVSVLAVAPTMAWVLAKDFGGTVAEYAVGGTTLAARMEDGSDQFLRGLILKTFIANLALTVAAFMAAGRLSKQRERYDAILLGSMLIVVILAFASQTTAVSIKERSFIVIIPPLFYLAARALPLAEEKGGFAARAARWAPILAIATPFLFIPEHFKDRERLGEVRESIAAPGTCAGEPMLVFYRPTPQSPGFQPWFNNRVLAPTRGGPPKLIPVETATPQDVAAVKVSACPVKGLALSMPRGERQDHADARAAFAKAGLDLSQLDEVNRGEGRSLLFQAR